MEYKLRASNDHTLMPVYRFDGDEAVDDTTYSRIMAGGYMSTASYGLGAAKRLGVKIDAETFERWKRICNSAYLIDDMIDNADDTVSACDAYDRGLGQVFELSNAEILHVDMDQDTNDLLLPSIVLAKNSVTTLHEGKVEMLKAGALGISAIARQKVECDDVRDYMYLLNQEAHYTSDLITESVSESVRAQDAYPDFEAWCQQLMKMAILGDSTIDLKDDYEQHVTKVTPNVRNIAALALRACGAARAIVHDRPQRRATVASLIERSKFYR